MNNSGNPLNERQTTGAPPRLTTLAATIYEQTMEKDPRLALGYKEYLRNNPEAEEVLNQVTGSRDKQLYHFQQVVKSLQDATKPLTLEEPYKFSGLNSFRWSMRQEQYNDNEEKRKTVENNLYSNPNQAMKARATCRNMLPSIQRYIDGAYTDESQETSGIKNMIDRAVENDDKSVGRSPAKVQTQANRPGNSGWCAVPTDNAYNIQSPAGPSEAQRTHSR
jgi:hypothetical protein